MTKQKMLIIAVLVIAGIVHSFGMFRFPYYENDEGVYVSQAWSLLTRGTLAPYTYWYDHAPGGWILLALWYFLTGGFFTFGFSINSGRVCMLVLQLLSTLLLYKITYRMTNRDLVAFTASLIFALTPLGIYFHRRVLLDNIMTFWVLLSLYLALHYNYKLRYIILSGICFGIAILSKENAIFFIPVFLYILFVDAHARHRSFALVVWLSLAGLVTATYFLLALLKGELFPPGTFLGGTHAHVSLLATLKEQYSRGGGGGILDIRHSAFWNSARVWYEEDPVILIFGAISTVINLLVGIKYYAARLAALLSLSMWLFLLRGGLVIEFYIIPLLPFLALNISITAWCFGQFLDYQLRRKNYQIARLLTGLVAVGTTLTSFYFDTNIRNNLNVFTADQTKPQIQAVNWILSRQSPNAFFVIDNYGYVDLQVKGKNRSFRNAEWYWKVDRDPEISLKLLENKPDSIGYIALTPQMEHDITSAGLPLTLTAWHNAKPFASFWNDGWGVEFWGTTYPSRVLMATWQSYKQNFIHNGMVSGKNDQNSTTSEAESYALLRAVWLNDRQTFDQVYTWFNVHMQQKNGLYSWKWQDNGLLDQGTASDADQDTALALIFASKQWSDSKYLDYAKTLLAAIWDNETATVDGRRYMTAANWANHDNSITINPSYLSPAYYRIYSEADPAHNWMQLVATSYDALSGCTDFGLNNTKGVLPSEWCSLDKKTLVYGQPGEFQPHATEYAYNAFRVPWRVSLDVVWFDAQEAKNYFSKLSLFHDEYTKRGKLSTAYTHDGKVWEDYESVSAYSGNLGYFIAAYPSLAKSIYQTKILPKLYEDSNQSYWEDPNNYYTQNWAWFGTALYTDSLPNLWQDTKILSFR